MVKQCILCGKEFETIKYGGARKYCFECSPKEYPQKVLTTIRQKAKALGVEKLGGQCRKCGIDKIYLLDFHHINPEEKEDNLSEFSRLYDLDSFFKELEKCDLLCANCHREFHHLHRIKNIAYEDYLLGQY